MEILGIYEEEKLPKLKDAKRAYYEQSKALHPDKHAREDENTRKHFEEKFKELLTAYRKVCKFIIKN